MIIEPGTRVHVIYRALYAEAVRRHFVGEVKTAEGAVCRIEGFAFVLDRQTGNYEKRPDRRTTIMDLGENGYIVNVLPSHIDIDKVHYQYLSQVGTVVTDGAGFTLNINEYGSKS